MPRQLEYMRIDKLPADPRNPKLHDVEGIKASMARFGYVEPVVIDERTGQLVSGHGRVETLQAAQAAGLDRPEGVDVDDDGTWAIPVLRGWASKDDNEAAAFIVAANRLVETGGYDDDALSAILSEITDTDLGLDGTGFDAKALDDLLGRHATSPTEDAGGQEVPENFMVVIECKTEAEQTALLDRLSEEGLAVRALIS